MFRASRTAATVFVVAASVVAFSAAAVPIDDFEDGTTRNWQITLLGMGGPGLPLPSVVSSGGPLGVDDAYLSLRSLGGSGAGSRLTALNLAQWAGSYTGIARIELDARNFGTSDLALRLLLENPRGAGPTDVAITASQALPSGGDWTHLVFDLSSLTALAGSLAALLPDVTALRILHAPAATFPGPSIVASLGIDNIAAVDAFGDPTAPSRVASPGAGMLLLGALAALAAVRRRA
jgi:MYXO-CTERM domain-containing protein